MSCSILPAALSLPPLNQVNLASLMSHSITVSKSLNQLSWERAIPPQNSSGWNQQSTYIENYWRLGCCCCCSNTWPWHSTVYSFHYVLSLEEPWWRALKAEVIRTSLRFERKEKIESLQRDQYLRKKLAKYYGFVTEYIIALALWTCWLCSTFLSLV